MSTETATDVESDGFTALEPWQAGLVGGLVGGVIFGAMMSAMMTPVMEGAIPSMYGLEGGLAGWFFHMSHAAVLGVAFGALLELTPLGDLADSPPALVGSGLVYGIVLWAVLAVVVMPIWVMGLEAGIEAVPNVAVESLLGHAVYGAVLGAVAVFLTE